MATREVNDPRQEYALRGLVGEKKLTFEEWVKKSQIYYHLSRYDGDWSLEQGLQACWKAAQENK